MRSLKLKNSITLGFILFSFFASSNIFGQTFLTQGDIAFSAYQSDNPDMFSFVNLKPIEAGTSITFTDNGWYAAGGFRDTEGALTWTATADLPCGTEVLISISSASTGIVAETNLGFLLSVSGDQVIAYQGFTPVAGNEYSILAAINMNSSWDADASNSNTSALPSILVNGETAIAIIPERDNAVYNCALTSGTAEEIRLALNDENNWTSSDSDLPDMSGCGFTITDGCEDEFPPLLNGDVAFTGYQSDNPDMFNFVLLRDIPEGTIIYFTDNGWFGSGGFRETEGIIAWVADQDFSCGTEVMMSSDAASIGLFVEVDGGFALSTSGDQIFASLGPLPLENGSGSFLGAISMNGIWTADATSSSNSALPSDFTDGENSLFIIPERDNGSYNCAVTSGSSRELRQALYDANNWETSSTQTLDELPMCQGFTVTHGCQILPIPTLSQWGLLILFLSISIFGLVAFRRRDSVIIEW